MKNVLTDKATDARRAYYQKWNAENSDRIRLYNLKKWESKACQTFGSDYIPPKDGEILSRQASELRRQYYADYRKKHPERIKASIKKFWERKAQENECKENSEL